MYYDYFESYYIIMIRVLILAVKANGADLVGITLLNKSQIRIRNPRDWLYNFGSSRS